MDYCIKCDCQMIHLEEEDVCPNCGYSSLYEYVPEQPLEQDHTDQGIDPSSGQD